MIEITEHGRIREIRLNRPPVNALNPELVGQLTRSLENAHSESDAIVLSGRQGMFSAGLDVVELLQLDRQAMTLFWQSFIKLLEVIACSPVPVAVAITGHSPAGGAVVSMMADYRVMSRGGFKIGLNETGVGLIVPVLLQDAMVRLVGPRIAEKMVVAGTLVDPQQALEIGFIDALETGYEETIQHALQWCEQILALPRHAMMGNRVIARAHFKREFDTRTNETVQGFVENWFSAETQDVLNSFVAKLKSRK